MTAVDWTAWTVASLQAAAVLFFVGLALRGER